MRPPIRLCLPRFDALYGVEERLLDDGSKNYRVKGVIESPLQLFFDSFAGLNVSWIQSGSVGRLKVVEDRRFDGCIGSLQANESEETVPLFTSYPIDGPNLTTGSVAGVERLGLLSAYDTRTDYKETQALDMVSSFDHSLWFTIFAVFAILAIVLMIARLITRPHKLKRSRVNQETGRAITTLVACLLHQFSSVPSGPEIRSKRKTIVAVVSTMVTLITLVCFFVTFYLTSMIKTDMVVF